MWPIASSATLIDVAAGVFTTLIPFSFAALESTLSRPTPALPMILSFEPAFITSAVTFVADLTMMAS